MESSAIVKVTFIPKISFPLNRLFASLDPSPIVIALLRGPFGRYAWSLQLRNSPVTKKLTSQSSSLTQQNIKESVKSNTNPLDQPSKSISSSALNNRNPYNIEANRSSENVPKWYFIILNQFFIFH
jgi:hypothetical protein